MSVLSWKDCLLDPKGCAATAGKEVINQTFWNSIVNWLAKGLNDMVIKVFDKVTTSTTPDFDQAWWRENLDLIVTISLPLLVIAFVLQCASAAIRREPARLGQALLGAILGTAGIPFTVAAVAVCGRMVDQISSTILGHSPSATKGLARMVDITGSLTVLVPQGGFMVTAIQFAILATIALYFVLLVREVALIAFVVLAPIAMASWTWGPTRHWLRRWIELVGSLLFSKMVMAVIFALGLSAIGNSTSSGDASLGTFLAGSLLFAMAAFAPIATYSFIHWAGDQGQAAMYALQQGSAGASAMRAGVERAYRWAAFDFTGSRSGHRPVVGESTDPPEETASNPARDATSHGPHDDGQETWTTGPAPTAEPSADQCPDQGEKPGDGEPREGQ